MEKKLDLSPIIALRAPIADDDQYEHCQTWIVRDSFGDFSSMYLHWYDSSEGKQWHKFVLDDKDRQEKEEKIESLTESLSRYKLKYETIRSENKSSVLDQLKKMRSELDLLLLQYDKTDELNILINVCNEMSLSIDSIKDALCNL